MQFQKIALTAILATAMALPLPAMISHFSFKRQVSAGLPGAITGAVAGISGAAAGGVAGVLGAVNGAVASIGGGVVLPI